MRYISRSQYAAYSDCKRKGYWGYIFRGGLTAFEPSRALLMGIVVHRGLEAVLHSGGSTEGMEALLEACWLAEGGALSRATDRADLGLCVALVLGWVRVCWEEFIAEYEIVSIERETPVELGPGVTLQCRADIVVRDRATGLLIVWNWKTSESSKDWGVKWRFDLQSITEAVATEEALGEPVAGTIFEGLLKSGFYDGERTSPLIRAYREEKVDKTTSETYILWKWEKPTGKGVVVEKTNALEYPGGVRQWVADLPEDVVRAQYIRSEIIAKNEWVARETISQMVKEESTNERMLQDEVPEEDRLEHFRPERKERCRWCIFSGACWDGMDVNDLALGVRVDHHTGGAGQGDV